MENVDLNLFDEREFETIIISTLKAIKRIHKVQVNLTE